MAVFWPKFDCRKPRISYSTMKKRKQIGGKSNYNTLDNETNTQQENTKW